MKQICRISGMGRWYPGAFWENYATYSDVSRATLLNMWIIRNEADRLWERHPNKVKDRYNRKVYDDMKIRVPKGKKQPVEDHAKCKGYSVNGLVNELLRTDMGLSEEEWKRISEADE